MAATTRTITIDFKDILNAGWANASLRIALLTAVAVDDDAVHPTEHIHVATDADGVGSVALAVPASGAWNYKMSLPDGNSYIVPIGAGTAVTLASLLSAAFPPADNPTLDEYYLRRDGTNNMQAELPLAGDPAAALGATPRQYVDLRQSKDTDATQGNAAIFDANGQTVDAGFALGTAAQSDVGDFDAAGSAAADDLVLARMMDARNVYQKIIGEATANKPLRPITLQYSSASLYYFWQYVSNQFWSRWKVTKNASDVWFLGSNVDIYSVYEATNDTDAGITYNGAWYTNTVASNIGASVHYCVAAGVHMEFDISGNTELWIAYSKTSSAGYVVPTIDGSQTLVDKRTLEYEGIAGEWVFNTYGASLSYNHWVRIADGLDPSQTYRIRLTTSTTTASPGGNRFYFEAYGKPASRVDAPGVLDVTHASVQTTLQAFKMDAGTVLSITPPGATIPELTGGAHVNESMISVAWVDADGNSCEPTSAIEYQTLNEFSLIQTAYMRHSETGATNHALITKILQFNNRKIRQSARFDWLDETIINYYYTGLVKTNGDFGAIAGDNTIYNPTNGDHAQYGNIKSLAALLWSSSNDYVIMSVLENPQQHKNFVTGGIAYIEDMDVGVKIYFEPQSTPVTPSIDDVWYFSHNWTLARIPRIEDYL